MHHSFFKSIFSEKNHLIRQFRHFLSPTEFKDEKNRTITKTIVVRVMITITHNSIL